MARDKGTLTNIDNSDLANYPFGRLKNNTGGDNGTSVNEFVYGDIHENLGKLLRLAGVVFNGTPDNEASGYQYVEALKHLAGKNDLIHDLTSVTGVLKIPVKLSYLVNKESLTCVAIADYNSESTISGITSTVQVAVTAPSGYKAGDYLRLINTPTGINIVRLLDFSTLDQAVTELNYLKKATGAETITGIIDDKAVTPEAFLEAFAEYVTGATSSNFLADVSQNGLYSKEHWAIVNALGAPERKNLGWFSGVDIGGNPVNSLLAVSGNILEAKTIENVPGGSKYTISFQNAMANTNYFVRMHRQDEGTGYASVFATPASFKPINTSQFSFIIGETGATAQNLKFHIEVIQLY